jgi:hypothetical protein
LAKEIVEKLPSTRRRIPVSLQLRVLRLGFFQDVSASFRCVGKSLGGEQLDSGWERIDLLYLPS